LHIVVISPVHDPALQSLERDHHTVVRAFNPTQHELESLVAEAEVLIFRSGVQIDAHIVEAASRLRLLVRAGAGTDNIDVAAAEAAGVRIVTIPEPGAKAVAEMAFTLMLALARNVLEADRSLRAGHWRKHALTGRALGGKTLGVLGAGNIGSRVARLGVAWGMDALGAVEYPTPRLVQRLARQDTTVVALPELLSRSDYVSVHVPLQPSTKNLLDRQALAQMRPGAFLVNLARGGVVDEHALYEALVAGHLAGAALDVHAREGEGEISPLASLPNVILTPHIGAGTREAQAEIGERILEVIREADGKTDEPPGASVAHA
jgi:D-3-phosphoglycerate dehydrogenase / 2-oxoglutarate reductase